MDIEYEKDGIRKFANERFKDDLISVGWSVISKENHINEDPEDIESVPVRKRGRPAIKGKE